MAVFEVPEQFVGMTLRDLRKQRKEPFRSDVLGQYAGIGEDVPLTASMSFNAPDQPGSAEYQFLQSAFSPAGTFAGQQRDQFFDKQAAEEAGFLGRFKEEYPQVLQGIEQQLGLPQLRESAFGLGETLRNIPDVQEQATQGFDVTANQLARMIASEQEEIAPLAQEATRLQQFAEEEFGRRADIALAPYQTELQLMSDRLAREATGFGVEQQGRLDQLLQKLRNEGSLAVAEMNQATQLAELEESKRQFENSLSPVDLGDRIALINPSTGEEMTSFPKGLAPKRGTDTMNFGNLYEEYLETLKPQGGGNTQNRGSAWVSPDYNA